jgi:hypothetical protein
MKLISMSDYVLDYASVLTVVDNFKDLSKVTNSIFNYASFLKQPLKLEMFVPCDENDEILKEPKFFYTEENIKKFKGVEIEIALSERETVQPEEELTPEIIAQFQQRLQSKEKVKR